MKAVLPQITFTGGSAPDEWHIHRHLSVREETVLFVSSLLHNERRRRDTRAGTRALSCFKQAILVIRWFLDGTRISQLATDNAIGKSTASTTCTRASTCSPPGPQACTPRRSPPPS
jgi:hypothetical protein